MTPVDSRQISWWPVHEFIAKLVAEHGRDLPVVGTPAWCALPDHDQAKLLALAAAGEHHVLRVETAQAAMAEASKAVAAGTEWRTRPRGNAYIQRKDNAA
jgi:hypothetical protein